MSSIIYILTLVVSIVFLIIGIQYLLKRGWNYRKIAEKKSDEFIRNIGLAFLIIGSLLFIMSIYELFIKI
ncbi:MAG: hypothetical protein ACTSRG_22145 [Candidatus Helarchaeota archaeon]